MTVTYPITSIPPDRAIDYLTCGQRHGNYVTLDTTSPCYARLLAPPIIICVRCGGNHDVVACPIHVTVEEAREEARRRSCCDAPQQRE